MEWVCLVGLVCVLCVYDGMDDFMCIIEQWNNKHNNVQQSYIDGVDVCSMVNLIFLRPPPSRHTNNVFGWPYKSSPERGNIFSFVFTSNDGFLSFMAYTKSLISARTLQNVLKVRVFWVFLLTFFFCIFHKKFLVWTFRQLICPYIFFFLNNDILNLKRMSGHP